MQTPITKLSDHIESNSSEYSYIGDLTNFDF